MNGPSIGDYFQVRIENMTGEIRRESAETILGTNAEELAQYYAGKYSMQSIEIIKGPELSITEGVRDVPNYERDPMYRGEGPFRNMPFRLASVDVWLDDFPDLADFWQLNTSIFSLSESPRDFVINQNRLNKSFEIKGYGFELSDDQVANRVEEIVRSINQYIQWKNKDIEDGNSKILNSARGEIDKRRQAIEKNALLLDSLEKKISIPLVKQASTAAIKPKVQIKLAVERMKPATQPIEQYELDHGRVLDILRFIDEFMKSLERTSGSISSLGEEELRDLVLAHLNGVFEGRATGETFSKRGKTDIYLNIDKGNILVAECKIWGGVELLHKTVDQIRGYLTWRHNYGVVIFFSRNKNFTQARDTLRDNVINSSSYNSGFKQIDETHFVAKHLLEDPQKTVEVHYLIYDLPVKK
jgi:hypothetical protein